VPAQLKKARQDEDKDQALDILKQLNAINIASLTVLNEARAAGQGDLVLRAVDRIQRQLELQGRLLGQLQDGSVVNVLVSPQWVSIRGALLSALGPYPDARAAVARRLRALDA
jgi:hypothetical protein